MIEQFLRATLGEPTLRVRLVERGGRELADVRRELRALATELGGEFETLSAEQQLRVADLATPLVRVGKRYCSITHATERAGVLVASRPCGFDLETIARVKEPIVARIASPDEVSEAPAPAALWTAKEAAFKALASFKQPQTVSQIRIGAWKNLPGSPSRFGTFRILNGHAFEAPDGVGCVFEHAGDALAAFLF